MKNLKGLHMFKQYAAPILTLGIVFSTIAAPVVAQGRPDTRRMSCDQAQDLVDRHGAIVMTTGRYTYERIVRNRTYCDYDENVWQVYAPTRDEDRCNIGYKCVPEYIMRFDD